MSETPYQRILAGRERLYFLHVPRTAGTSTTALLDGYFARAAICPWQTSDRLHSIPPERWRGFQFYRGHLGADLHRLLGHRPMTMTLLRDPVASAASAFRDAQRLGAIAPGERLETFAASPAGRSMAWRFRAQLLPDAAARLQRMRDDETVAMAIEQLEQFAFVGVTEQLDASMQLLAHTMGWPCPAAMPQLNRTAAADREPTLSAAARARVEERVAVERPIHDCARRLLAERHDAMVRELLERSDRDRLRGAARIASFDADLAAALPGIGWGPHAAGDAGCAPHRWLGPGTEATLRLPLRHDRGLLLAGSFSQPFAPASLATIAIDVNGHPVRVRTTPTGPTRVAVVAMLTADVLRLDPDLTQIRIRWRDAGVPAGRPRGICCHRLLVAPRVVAAEFAATTARA